MPKRRATDARKTRLSTIAAARALFAEKGFDGTRTAEIARRAGVTEGALFHYFPSKLDLFRVVFEELELELDEHARARSRTGDALAAFLSGCAAYLRFARRKDFQRIVMIDGPRVLGEAEWHSADSRLGLKTVTRAMEHLMAKGVLARQPAKPLAVLVLGALNEAGFAIARNEPGVTAAGCLKALERLIRGSPPVE